MKCSFGISNFLEEISSLFHSIVFLYFFVLITEEGFLFLPPMNPASQALGKADLEDLFSGVVSTELVFPTSSEKKTPSASQK